MYRLFYMILYTRIRIVHVITRKIVRNSIDGILVYIKISLGRCTSYNCTRFDIAKNRYRLLKILRDLSSPAIRYKLFETFDGTIAGTSKYDIVIAIRL